VGAVYIVQSSSDPWLFGLGLHWEAVVYAVNLALILTFPTGRLDSRAAKAILVAAIVLVALPFVAALLLAPRIGADGSISGCLAACPDNALAIASRPELASDIYRFDRVATIVVAMATGALLIWRMLHGTPPQRRAVAIGAPVALVFTALQIAYQGLHLLDPDSAAIPTVQWALAGARSLIWYGFMAALIAAQLFAARGLRSLVHRSLRRPSQQELEDLLRTPLGDPGLRLVFADAERVVAQRGRAVTVVERGDGPPVAIDSSTTTPSCCRRRARWRCWPRRTRSWTRRGSAHWTSSRSPACGSSPPPTTSGASSSATCTTASSRSSWPRRST
jgi:hypothetical protein